MQVQPGSTDVVEISEEIFVSLESAYLDRPQIWDPKRQTHYDARPILNSRAQAAARVNKTLDDFLTSIDTRIPYGHKIREAKLEYAEFYLSTSRRGGVLETDHLEAEAKFRGISVAELATLITTKAVNADWIALRAPALRYEALDRISRCFVPSDFEDAADWFNGQFEELSA